MRIALPWLLLGACAAPPRATPVRPAASPVTATPPAPPLAPFATATTLHVLSVVGARAVCEPWTTAPDPRVPGTGRVATTWSTPDAVHRLSRAYVSHGGSEERRVGKECRSRGAPGA